VNLEFYPRLYLYRGATGTTEMTIVSATVSRPTE